MVMTKLERTRPHVTIGTIGSASHGKTMLASALTKFASVTGWDGPFQDYASLKAAMATRISSLGISTVHVEYGSGGRDYTHIDSPGTDCIKNMMTGVAQIDAAILVCSANEDPTQQTLEDIRRAYSAGVPYIIVFLNKMDLVGEGDLTDQIETKVRGMLSDCGYPGDDAPVIAGSALLAVENDLERTSIAQLLGAIDICVKSGQAVEDPFLMRIDNVQPAPGGDTSLAGYIERGTVQPGNLVEVVGLKATMKATVTAVEVAGKSSVHGSAGSDAVVRVHGLKPGDVQCGQFAIEPGSIKPSTRFAATIYILSKEDGGSPTPLDTTIRWQFRFRGLDVAGSIVLSDGVASPKPGDLASVEVTLDIPTVIAERQRFSLHKGDLTVAFGIVSPVPYEGT